LDGKHLPDPGFFDPNSDWVSHTATDIFSVGSILTLSLLGTGHTGALDLSGQWRKWKATIDRSMISSDNANSQTLKDSLKGVLS
jgi:hypothetical protein